MPSELDVDQHDLRLRPVSRTARWYSSKFTPRQERSDGRRDRSKRDLAPRFAAARTSASSDVVHKNEWIEMLKIPRCRYKRLQERAGLASFAVARRSGRWTQRTCEDAFSVGDVNPIRFQFDGLYAIALILDVFPQGLWQSLFESSDQSIECTVGDDGRFIDVFPIDAAFAQSMES